MDATREIDKQIADLGDWRGEMMTRIRKLIHEVDSEIVEEWKWGTPVFTRSGIVCAVGAFQNHVKINFFKGASLADPHKLFNAGLDAKATRAIDIAESDKIDEPALKDLIHSAVDFNISK